MKVYYLAGPYRAQTPNGIFNNILEARNIALKYWKMGYVVLTPHLNCMLFDGELDDNVFLNGDIELLNRCDGIIMMKNYQLSSGSINELNHAIYHGKEVIYD